MPPDVSMYNLKNPRQRTGLDEAQGEGGYPHQTELHFP